MRARRARRLYNYFERELGNNRKRQECDVKEALKLVGAFRRGRRIVTHGADMATCQTGIN